MTATHITITPGTHLLARLDSNCLIRGNTAAYASAIWAQGFPPYYDDYYETYYYFNSVVHFGR